MSGFNTVLPFVSSAVSFIFALFVLRRYLVRHGPHLLLWGIGMIMYAIGGFCEGYYGAEGWNPVAFRLWYLFGAVLVAAWLGQGTVYLLVRERWANISMAGLAAASLFGAYRVFGATLDPAAMSGSVLSGHAIVSPGVRSLTPIFNVYGTLTLVGGAAYSAYIFWRKRVLLHRVIGNVLIAAGALLPAFGGSFSRFGITGTLYISEFLGALLMFAGFIRATSPITNAVTRRQRRIATE